MNIVFDFFNITLKLVSDYSEKCYDFSNLDSSEIEDILIVEKLNSKKITHIESEDDVVILRPSDQITINRNLLHIINLIIEYGCGETFIAVIRYLYDNNADTLYSELSKDVVESYYDSFIGDFNSSYDAGYEFHNYHDDDRVDITDYIDYGSLADDFLRQCYSTYYFLN